MKFIVVTGGIISGLGKGITASSIGLLLQSLGLSVTAIKIDPYLNFDSGLMSPFQHGETYVLADGGETDLDLGNYERFLDVQLTKDHNITTGKVYTSVLQKERNGDYLGKTVQVIPHITDEIQDKIMKAAHLDVGFGTPDICIIELGGTIGDIETAPYTEALTRLCSKYGPSNFCFVHVSLILNINGESKSKPTQHSIRTLRSLGIVPNILVLRTDNMLDDDTIEKININCGISKENIICNINVPNIYFVPDLFKKQNICEKISTILNLNIGSNYNLNDYYKILDHFNDKTIPKLKVGVAGKYVGMQDTYLSLIRAIEHASFHIKTLIEIIWIDTEQIEKNDEPEWSKLKMCDKVIIPGGFGSRGIGGKILVAHYCRTKNIKILGICLGMQIMVVEYARSLGYKNAMSKEWSNHGYHIIDMLPDQNGVMGGTMRLGNYESVVNDTVIKQMYGQDTITERHRHRYELTMSNAKIFENSGLIISVLDNKANLVEVVRLDGHPFYVGCQFHPEFKSRYNKPHPLFINLLI
jgi:CTP synthase